MVYYLWHTVLYESSFYKSYSSPNSHSVTANCVTVTVCSTRNPYHIISYHIIALPQSFLTCLSVHCTVTTQRQITIQCNEIDWMNYNLIESHPIFLPSHHIISYHIISYHIVSYRIVSYRIIYYQHEATQDTIASWEGVHAHRTCNARSWHCTTIIRCWCMC